MFRHRLGLVLMALAVAIALQGAGALWAVQHVERKVLDGRTASDLHQGFVELSATKQRLRAWVTQYLIGAGGDVQQRDALHASMQATVDRLRTLALQSAPPVVSGGHPSDELARLDAIEVVASSVADLGRALPLMQPLPPDLRARDAWDSLDGLFEQTKGRDVREVVAQSIAREAAAVAREREAADRSLRWMYALWMGFSLALVAAALLATWYFNRALRQPLDVLVDGAQALRSGDLSHRIDVQGQHEFADVARSMNTMAEALWQHEQAQTRQRQQLEALVQVRTAALGEANDSLRQTDQRRRQLLADISHELRTPTTAIRGEAEITLRGRDRSVAEYREALQRIVNIARQLGAVIDDLLAMARTDMDTLAAVRETVDLYEPLADAWTSCGPLAAKAQVRLGTLPIGPDTVWVIGDRQRLTQLLLLLLDNAVRYSYAQGEVGLHAVLTQDDQGRWIELSVVDQGIGIPSHELPLVFDRHFRGAEAIAHAPSGNGLGLGIAWRLAQSHGGSLSVQSPAMGQDATGQGAGTCVTVRLPVMPHDKPSHADLE